MRNVIDDNVKFENVNKEERIFLVKRNCVTRSMMESNEFNNNEAEKNEKQSNLMTENKSSKKNVFTKIILKSNCVTRSVNLKKSKEMIHNVVKDHDLNEEKCNFKTRALNATCNYLLRSENSCPIKYITKDALTPTTSLSLLSHPREKVLAYPSQATDSGSRATPFNSNAQ